MALSRKNRLADKNRIKKVVYSGKRIETKEAVIWFLENGLQGSRLAVAVPKKVDKRAVVRNKIRRRTGEIIGGFFPKMKKNYDFFIKAKTESADASFASLKKSLEDALGLVLKR